LQQKMRAIDRGHTDIRFDLLDLVKASRTDDSVLLGLQIEDWHDNLRQFGANVTTEHGTKAMSQHLRAHR
jgi:hypothetical protein